MQTLPIWLTFAGLSIPIALLALASISLAWEPFSATDPELVDTDIVTGQTITDAGTVTRTYTVILPDSRNTTIYIGPLALTANARAWAGYCSLLGLLLLGVGLVGMLHFPAQSSSPVIPGAYTDADFGTDPGSAENGG